MYYVQNANICFPNLGQKNLTLVLLPALPVQHGLRRGAVFSALIIYQGGRDFMLSLHTTFWFTRNQIQKRKGPYV